MAKFEYRMIQAESGETVVESVQLANTFWSRFCGLQFRSPLEVNQGILLAPCSSIHTHWMRFSIAAVMLGKDGRVLAVHPEIHPWRIRSAPGGTHAVLETVAGSKAAELQVGSQLKLVATDGAELSTPVFN